MPSLQQEYDDAMLTADVALRQLESRAEKVHVAVGKVVAEAELGRLVNAKQAGASALAALRNLQVAFQSPDLSQWRSERQAAQKRRIEQQQVLTQKLAAAKALLLDAGWEHDALEEHLKANAPTGRALAQRSFRERNARKRKASLDERSS